MKLMYRNWLFFILMVDLTAAGCAVEVIDDIIADKGVTYCSMGVDGSGDEASEDTTASSTFVPECSTGSTAPATTTGEGGESSSTGEGTTSETTGHVPMCGDGVVEGEETCDDMNDIPDDGCKACARDSIIFITSERYRGDINGLDGADQRCRMLAAIAGLQRFETFRAWLSTGEVAAADRLLQSQGRYVLVNGLVVAENWDGLVSGTLLHPIDVDEFSQTQDYRAWTGTLFDGQPAFGSEFCNGWTTFSGDFMGGNGFSSVVDATWSFVENINCNFDLHLYCIEQ